MQLAIKCNLGLFLEEGNGLSPGKETVSFLQCSTATLQSSVVIINY